MVISVAKHEILKPPLCPPKKIPSKNILKKLYIYLDKKDGDNFRTSPKL